ncbi:MAG: hypothetical protein Q8O09_05160, partial [Bacillota bacterium]|nr:hypothetical protein [Bacillota bacterium]
MMRFSINSIALGNLRRRKRSYIMLAVAVVLTIYFAAATLLFASTIFTSIDELHYNRYGSQDAIILNCKDAPLDELIAKGTFKEYGTASVIGYAITDERSMSGGFSVASFDDTALRLARKNAIEGRLPQKAGEIAIEKSMLARLRTGAGIGDEVSLTLKIPDGTGFLENTLTKAYTLTGILADQLIYEWDMNPAYRDYPAAVISGEEEIEAGGKAVIQCYGSYAGDAKECYEKVTGFCVQNGLQDAYGNPDFNSTHYGGLIGYATGDDDQSIILSTGFLSIIALILVFAACLGIVNAFTANLEERRRQIGLLRAVGA